MPFIHIVRKVYAEPWCITPEAHAAIVAVLESRLGGMDVASINPAHAQIPFTPLAAGAGLNPPRERGSRLWTKGKLGVIPVYGMIGSHLSSLEMMCGGYGVEQLMSDLDDAARDDRLENVMLDFHSPGGHITGIPEAAKQFADLGKTKKTFAFSSGLCASAAYWIASQANHVYGTTSSMWGSIGVYLPVVNQSKAIEARGEKITIIKAGEHKAMGHPSLELSDEQREYLQGQVNDSYAAFTSAVKSKRGGIKKETMQGLVYRGVRARESALVDSLVTSLGSIVTRLS